MCPCGARGAGPASSGLTASTAATLRRALGAATQVRAQEAGLAALMGLNIFFILTAQYILKPVRDALVLALPHGAEYKSYASSALVALMLLIVPLYGAVAGRLRRNVLLHGTTLMCMAAIAAFWVLLALPALRPWLAVPFYLFVGIFGMMAVAQFWAFANDIYDEEQGLRLFVWIALGQSLGALAGSGATALLLAPPAFFRLAAFDERSLLLLSLGCLAPTLAIIELAHRHHSATPDGPVRARPSSSAPHEVFQLVLGSRYLLLLGLLHSVFTLVKTNGEYIMSVLVAAAAPAAGEQLAGLDRTAWIGQFYGSFYLWVGALGLALQVAVVSRLVKHGGLSPALLTLPLLAVGAAGLSAAIPVLAVVAAAMTLENAADYSLHNTVRQMLWLPTSRDAKYKAKQAVDTFFVRFGDAASGLLVWAGIHAFGWSVRGFALANLCLAAGWVGLAIRVGRENSRLERHQPATAAPAPLRRAG